MGTNKEKLADLLENSKSLRRVRQQGGCSSCNDGSQFPADIRRSGTGANGEPLYVCGVCGKGMSDDG